MKPDYLSVLHSHADFVFARCPDGHVIAIDMIAAVAKIQAALALTDTDSPEFQERFGLSRPQYTAGWNVVEAIREVLLP